MEVHCHLPHPYGFFTYEPNGAMTGSTVLASLVFDGGANLCTTSPDVVLLSVAWIHDAWIFLT